MELDRLAVGAAHLEAPLDDIAHADPPARRSLRLDTTAGFLACYFPRPPFRIMGQPSDPETSPSSLPATRAIQRCASWRSYNDHRPHRTLRQAAHSRPLPHRAPTDLHKIGRRDRLGGVLHEYQQVA